MSYELCTTYDAHRSKGDRKRTFDVSAGMTSMAASLDKALEWMTEKLDRKFVSAMESAFTEDLKRKQEMKLFERAVLIILCGALGATVISIKLAVESSTIWAFFG